MRLYHYVGPPEVRERDRGAGGLVVHSVDDVRAWAAGRDRLPDDTVPATFVIDADGRLRLADRRSEHVACAGGGPVRSAGEMFLLVDDSHLEVVAVTNQSTGFCPEPASWPAVAAALALDAAEFHHPGGFTTEIVFRRCEGCGQRNVVKDGIFECGVCGGPLPADWNFAVDDS
jgi:hypothetical protein